MTNGERSHMTSDAALDATNLNPGEKNVHSLQASWPGCLPSENTITMPNSNLYFDNSESQLDAFLDDVDSDNQVMSNSGHGPVLLAMDQSHQAVELQPSQGRGMEKLPARLPSSETSLTRSKNTTSESHYSVSPDTDHSSRQQQIALLNSPHPSDNLAKAASNTVERPIDNLSSRGSLQYSNTINASRQATNIANLRAVTYVQPRNQERISPGSTLNDTIIEPTWTNSRQQQRSLDNASEDGTDDSRATSSESNLLWRHLIHTCCESGHLSLVEELIEAGLDINKKDSAGNTPLHIAAAAGHDDLMRYLLMKGCSVNAVNDAGWTAAHLASVKGHRRCLRLLLENNVSPWARLSVSD
ncbi:hypothetical protein F4824DRAFT_6300 [Ustulina deusta]|nr:hypothetical protein F4823DRAFT_302106 [Ustulina deusta]KAI3343379.1 hypothetical protein F4824DRAFT_6300 [Ustulina deusta]